MNQFNMTQSSGPSAVALMTGLTFAGQNLDTDVVLTAGETNLET